MCLIIVVFVIVEISSCLFQASAIVALKTARSLVVLRNSDDVDHLVLFGGNLLIFSIQLF